MRSTIFFRLVVGYFLIFILAIIVNIYVTFQFQKLEDITNSILAVNNRMASYNKRLIDALLSQVRYEKKFIILKDNSLYEQFLAARNDFNQQFNELGSLENSPQVKLMLEGIRQAHERYQNAFYKEVGFLRAGQRYPHRWYAQEKEKAIDTIMEGLKEIRTYIENSTYDKVKKLGEAGANASRAAAAITVFSLLFGITISIIVTRSITRPLAVLRRKTREISSGDYQSDLNLSSPPEIGELAQDFNVMCHKLKKIDKIKSDFISSMSHELRTPLTSIKEGTNLLLEGIGGETNEKQKRLLTIIRAETNRLIDLVNSLLDFSKMEAGMMTYTFTSANLAHLIQRTLTEIEPLLEAKKIRLEPEISKGLPIVKVDIERILQVLRNLIGNAVKFTSPGGSVRVSAKSTEQGVEVSVSDTGVGIPKENLAIIFNKFQQAGPTPEQIKGTGLGLAIVNHIISGHGGKIWAESEPGKGSTFTFVLPA